MKNFEVGTILYLIPKDNFVVVPAQVTEELTRKSLEGETIDYFIQVPGKEDQILLKEFNGDIFEDSSAVRKYLSKIANKKVDKLVSGARKVAQKYFKNSAVEEPLVNAENYYQDIEEMYESDDKIEVELSDGKKAKINMSDEVKELLR